MMKIWKRHFLKEILQVFFLFIFCFYGLYIVIDFTTHSGTFHHSQSKFDWVHFSLYYLNEFVHRSDVLVPFALLVATVRTLTRLNQSHELTALRAAGIPLKTLMRPFLFVGLVFTVLLYASEQWVLPASMGSLKQIQDAHSRHKRKLQDNMAAQHLVLQDETTLIFQKYDSAEGLFYDTYWVVSPDEIYRVQILNPHTTPPSGTNAVRFTRNEERLLTALALEPKAEFPRMRFNKKTLLETITPLEDLSLTRLWEKLPAGGTINSDKEAQITTAFYKKLAAPWLCLLAVIAPIPLCVRFSRQLPIFFLYALNVFGLVAVYLVIDAAQVLGKRQALDPAWAIWLPFFLFFSAFAWRYCRLR